MSLTLTATTLAIVPGMTSSFLGVGGIPPYTYTVIPDGIGGTIDGSGNYTSPLDNGIGTDIIQVQDAANATADLTILVDNPLELVCEIIQNEMGLAPGRVYLWDQKIFQPKDNDLYVVIGVLSCKPFGSSVYVDGSGSGLEAVQSLNMQATLSIDIFSRGSDARERKEEVVMALNSIYSQSQQEVNSFHIARITSSFQNISQEDGAAILYRFNISVNVQYMMKKTKAVGYYDTFLPETLTIES